MKSQKFFFLINIFNSQKPVFMPFIDKTQLEKTYKKGKQNSNKMISKIGMNFFVNKISKKYLSGFFDDGIQIDLAVSTLPSNGLK